MISLKLVIPLGCLFALSSALPRFDQRERRHDANDGLTFKSYAQACTGVDRGALLTHPDDLFHCVCLMADERGREYAYNHFGGVSYVSIASTLDRCPGPSEFRAPETGGILPAIRNIGSSLFGLNGENKISLKQGQKIDAAVLPKNRGGGGNDRDDDRGNTDGFSGSSDPLGGPITPNPLSALSSLPLSSVSAPQDLEPLSNFDGLGNTEDPEANGSPGSLSDPERYEVQDSEAGRFDDTGSEDSEAQGSEPGRFDDTDPEDSEAQGSEPGRFDDTDPEDSEAQDTEPRRLDDTEGTDPNNETEDTGSRHLNGIENPNSDGVEDSGYRRFDNIEDSGPNDEAGNSGPRRSGDIEDSDYSDEADDSDQGRFDGANYFDSDSGDEAGDSDRRRVGDPADSDLVNEYGEAENHPDSLSGPRRFADIEESNDDDDDETEDNSSNSLSGTRRFGAAEDSDEAEDGFDANSLSGPRQSEDDTEASDEGEVDSSDSSSGTRRFGGENEDSERDDVAEDYPYPNSASSDSRLPEYIQNSYTEKEVNGYYDSDSGRRRQGIAEESSVDESATPDDDNNSRKIDSGVVDDQDDNNDRVADGDEALEEPETDDISTSKSSADDSGIRGANDIGEHLYYEKTSASQRRSDANHDTDTTVPPGHTHHVEIDDDEGEE